MRVGTGRAIDQEQTMSRIGLSSVTSHMTNPYTAAESLFYDSVIAPAVAAMKAALGAREMLAALPQGADVLDVGAGGGQTAIDIARARPDVRLTGVDLSADQVRRATARARAAGLGERVRFIEGDALALPFPAASFDAALSIASLKHWPDRARGLAECGRILRPGGLLRVVEVDRGCHFEDARGFVARWRLPSSLRPFAFSYFRTYVAGQSLDIDEARTLAASLPLEHLNVARIPGTPALCLHGRRA
jgi:ubiquinone/menaquinone biosynthesis C-methylase UbiE